MDAGRIPESIKRLADLVEPAAVEAILLPMWKRGRMRPEPTVQIVGG